MSKSKLTSSIVKGINPGSNKGTKGTFTVNTGGVKGKVPIMQTKPPSPTKKSSS